MMQPAERFFAKEPYPFARVVFDGLKLFAGTFMHLWPLCLLLAVIDGALFVLILFFQLATKGMWLREILGVCWVLWQLGSFALLLFAIMVYALKPHARFLSLVQNGLRHLGRFYLAWFVGCFWVVLAFLLVIPGVYLLLCLPFVVALVYFTDTSVWQAIWRAERLIRHNWWYVFGSFMLTVSLMLLLVVFLGIAGWMPQKTPWLMMFIAYFGKWLVGLPLMASVLLMTTHHLLLIEKERLERLENGGGA